MCWLAIQLEEHDIAINTQRNVNTVYRRSSVFTTSNMALKTEVYETIFRIWHPNIHTKFKITMIGWQNNATFMRMTTERSFSESWMVQDIKPAIHYCNLRSLNIRVTENISKRTGRSDLHEIEDYNLLHPKHTLSLYKGTAKIQIWSHGFNLLSVRRPET